MAEDFSLIFFDSNFIYFMYSPYCVAKATMYNGRERLLCAANPASFTSDLVLFSMFIFALSPLLLNLKDY